MTLLFVYMTIALGVSFLCSILEAVLLSVTPSHVARLQHERPDFDSAWPCVGGPGVRGLRPSGAFVDLQFE